MIGAGARPKASGGYTIIEVMIFLAVSALIFFAAVIAVRGSQAHTEFSTATNDVNTKLQQWIDQVVNGFTASTADTIGSNFQCTLASGRPQLVAGTAARGANPQCVFLGKAIQVIDYQAGLPATQNPSRLYAYSILGARVDSTGNITTNLVGANPTAAIFQNLSGGDLTETYVIPNGVRVKYVKNGDSLSSLYGTSHLAGFFTSFNSGTASQNGSQSLLAVQYPWASNVNPDVQNGSISSCISFAVTPCLYTSSLSPSNPWPLRQWVICLESTHNTDTAAISVISSSGQGASTKVTIPCP